MLPLYSPAVTQATDTTSAPLRQPARAPSPLADRLLHAASLTAGAAILLMLFLLLGSLLAGAWPTLRHVDAAFLNRATPLLAATLATSLFALILAIIPALATAIFLTRIASPRLAAPLIFLVRSLAIIPSVAFGLWGVLVLVPFLSAHANTLAAFLPRIPGRLELLAASLILSVMILPLITAICTDIFQTIPTDQIEATLALGSTWWQSVCEMLRRSAAPLTGAAFLALGRATAETIAAAMVITSMHLTIPIPDTIVTDHGQTLTTVLATSFADTFNSLERSTLTELAIILMLVSLIFTLAARRLGVAGQTADLARG